MTVTTPLRDIEHRLLRPAVPGPFTNAELRGLPEIVRRHLAQAIAPGAPLATSARLWMRGHIRLGRWVPFRAREVLAPHAGLVWAARAGGVITGSDRYVEGSGRMSWKLAGLVTVMRGEGPNHDRSAAGRAGGEALWLPTALLPRFGVTWTVQDDHHITSHLEIGTTPVHVRYELDGDGRIVSFVFDRWGDPDRSGVWTWHPFGGVVTAYRTFGGMTIPSAGRAGWQFGTPAWPRGEFFRYEIMDMELTGAGIDGGAG